jgi:uncharacterized membrane protein YwzB
LKIYFDLNKLEQKVKLSGFVVANTFLLVSSIYFLIDKFGNIFTLENLSANVKINTIITIISIITNSIAIRSGYESELIINNNTINSNIIYIVLLILITTILSSFIVFLNLDMSRKILYGPTLISAFVVPLIMRLFKIND